MRNIIFLAERPASYVIFCSFFCLLPPFRLLPFHTEEKLLLQKMMVEEELVHPLRQCLQNRGIKEGHRLIIE